MKKWWLLVSFLVVVMSFSSYAKDCVVCNDADDVVTFYGCPDLKTCNNCINNVKYSSSALTSVCDATRCDTCHEPILSDAYCKSGCFAFEICSDSHCCRPNGATSFSDAACCTGFRVGIKCAAKCIPDWQCSAWSSCSSGSQTRMCTDSNSCGDTNGKPAESQSCQITPTCSDGVKNQGESGVDCGGPCTACPSGGIVTFTFTNKQSLYNIGDMITYTWSLPSYAYSTSSGCTVWFYANGVPDNVGWDGYVDCGHPGLIPNGGGGTLQNAHCQGKTGTVTNSIQMFIKDSDGNVIAQSGSDSYVMNCGSRPISGRCTCQSSGCGWEKCTQADVGKTMCKIGWTFMGSNYNEVRKCVYSEDDGCYLYLPVEDCSQKTNSGCALNTKSGKHECLCSTPCTPNEKKCVPTQKWESPAPPGDWEIQQCNADGCGWKELTYCGADEECAPATKTCTKKPCPYCCPSSNTCASPTGGTGCGYGSTCCSSQSSCTSCASECTVMGTRACFNSTTYRTCGNYDSDPCYEWGYFDCSGSQTCSGVGVCSGAATCPNAVCAAGENCPGDNVSCVNNKCYNPTCASGCSQVAVANGLTDEACYGNVGCGTGGSSDPVHKGRLKGDATTSLKSSTSVFVSGSYAYVTAINDNGLEIVDVSNPSNPVHKGKISINTPWKVFVSGNYSYIIPLRLPHSTSVALSIVDVSNPAQPSLNGVMYDDSTTLLNGSSDVFVSGNYAYIASGRYGEDRGLEIVDVSDPANPFHKGRLIDDSTTLLENPTGIHVSGNYAYISNGAVYGATGQLSNTPGLEIVDVSNPSAPVHRARLVDDGTTLLDSPRDVFVSGDYAYLINEGGLSRGLEVVDVSNPANPVHKSKLADDSITIMDSPTSVFVSGNYAYISNWMFPGGIEVVDVSNPAAPVHKGKITDSDSAWLDGLSDVFVSGTYIYAVGWGNDTLEILDVPTSGTGSNCMCNGLGSCVSGAGEDLPGCKRAGFSCSSSADCCSNLQCTPHQQCNPPGSSCCMPVAAACSDPDGTDYFTKTTTIGYGACTVQSSCPDLSSWVDDCLNSSMVREMVCQNGFVHGDPHHCPSGCDQGKCLGAQLTVTSSNEISLSDLKSVVISSISSYFSSSPVLTDAETKDLIAAYFSTVGYRADLSKTGQYSGSNLLDIYKKVLNYGTPEGIGNQCVASGECVKCGDTCIPHAQWSSYCADPTANFECECSEGNCKSRQT